MKQLKPVVPSPKNEQRTERSVDAVMYEAIFKDVFDIIREYNAERFENASSVLVSAIASGRVQYQGGDFTGSINARISRELRSIGAKFDKRRKVWTLPEDQAPATVIAASVSANERFKRLHADIEEALSPTKAALVIGGASFVSDYSQTMNNVELQFKKSVKPLGVTPQLSQDMVDTLAERYSNNMKLYIQKWAEPQILKLRELVQKNAFNGARAESLVKIIESEYGVSQRKAKFLAKQETKLVTSAFNQERYKSVGVTKYRWSTSRDERVREEHRELNGKVFQWGEAVIDDQGNKGDPGQAFGCRCIAIPVVE